MYCNRSCLWVCGGRCLWRAGGRCLLPRQLEITCLDLHQAGSLGAGSDHLQLIKFWRSCAHGICTGWGSVAGRKFLARSACVSLSAFFICIAFSRVSHVLCVLNSIIGQQSSTICVNATSCTANVAEIYMFLSEIEKDLAPWLQPMGLTFAVWR